MSILDIFTGNQDLFVAENNKKYKKVILEINTLLNEFCISYKENNEYFNSEKVKQNISLAKGMNEYFITKRLHLDTVLENYQKIEKDRLNSFNELKEDLISKFDQINNPTEGIVSLFNITDTNEIIKCETGKEIVILGEHNNIINQLISKVSQLSLLGNYDSTTPTQIEYNKSTLNQNIRMASAKAELTYSEKQNRLNKVMDVISRLQEVGEKVVAFYTYKNAFEVVGCNPKHINDYENELEKMYIPLKKTIQKELKIELSEICEISTNETNYLPQDDKEISEDDLTNAISLSQESPIQEETNSNPFSNMNTELNNNDESNNNDPLARLLNDNTSTNTTDTTGNEDNDDPLARLLNDDSKND